MNINKLKEAVYLEGANEDLDRTLMQLQTEAAEVTDLFLKSKRLGNEVDREKLLNELGDCFVALVRLAELCNFPLEEIVKAIETKKKTRFPSGKFTVEDYIKHRG